MSRILFVCLGNICRSPTAEAVTRTLAARRGLDMHLDSAGTGDWHIGKPPYGPMQNAARAAGYEMADLRARQVAPADFRRFDLIVAMDRQNRADLAAIRPGGDGAELALMTSFAPALGIEDVPDPYFTRDFDEALAIVETCARGLLDQLVAQNASAVSPKAR